MRYDNKSELYHWKYIKREWVGDKYKYYYRNKEKPGLINKVKDALGFDEEATYKTMNNTAKYHKSGVDMYDEEIQNIRTGKNGWDEYTGNKEAFINKVLKVDRDSEQRSLEEAKKTCEKVLKDYEKTPLYKIRKIQATIEKGKKLVADFFNKLF